MCVGLGCLHRIDCIRWKHIESENEAVVEQLFVFIFISVCIAPDSVNSEQAINQGVQRINGVAECLNHDIVIRDGCQVALRRLRSNSDGWQKTKRR